MGNLPEKNATKRCGIISMRSFFEPAEVLPANADITIAQKRDPESSPSPAPPGPPPIFARR